MKNGLLIKFYAENFVWKDAIDFRHWKITLKLRTLRSLTRLFIILVSLTMSSFSETMLISNRCIGGLKPNLIKKYWTVLALVPLSIIHQVYTPQIIIYFDNIFITTSKIGYNVVQQIIHFTSLIHEVLGRIFKDILNITDSLGVVRVLLFEFQVFLKFNSIVDFWPRAQRGAFHK